MVEGDDALRRSEELDALVSFYGQETIIAVTPHEDNNSNTNKDGTDNSTSSTRHHANTKRNAVGPESSIEPPMIWRIRISPPNVGDRDCCWLELHLPSDYPSLAPPTPHLCIPQWILDDGKKSILVDEMIEMWTEDVEIGLLWAEHCRSALLFLEDMEDETRQQQHKQNDTVKDDDELAEMAIVEPDAVRTFVSPNGTRYHQPIRHFQETVIRDESNRRSIHRGEPYHPPKSGASETLVAHVANVTHMNHVDWVLAQLLFEDKKVGRATHNMIAYRFYDDEKQCWVSDNDDDGEKGAGSKLGALLEMSNSENVLVVVSRWFGGVLLGPSRFKYIASTARDALQEAGYIIK